ncbi:MAG: hypothetical protein JSS56_00310 [Proteobacteria bacterium]|nr:hypothetical protein [Pseudomonadota bacterium]
MFHRVIQGVCADAKRIRAGYAITLIVCVLAVVTWNSPVGHVQAALEQPMQQGISALASPDTVRMAALRREAANGNQDASLDLSTALLDRYDMARNPDDLYEALEWMDRRWDVSDHTELVGRVVANYCGQRVVQWHRLCVLGE